MCLGSWRKVLGLEIKTRFLIHRVPATRISNDHDPADECPLIVQIILVVDYLQGRASAVNCSKSVSDPMRACQFTGGKEFEVNDGRKVWILFIIEPLFQAPQVL